MKKKIIGTLVCTLLIFIIFPATGALNEKTMNSTGGIESIPVIEFKDISTGIINNLLGFSVELKNSGEGSTGNIEWSMEISGGIYDIPFIKQLLVPKTLTYGEIEPLGHGESGMIKIGPTLLALGEFNVTFNCTYTIYSLINLSKNDECEADVSVIQEYRDQGSYLIWHTFPEEQQPVSEWMDITHHTYMSGGWVGLSYAGPPTGLFQKHNVRVYDPDSQQTVFLGACSFANGQSTIKECHVTQDIVENGNAYWQVELVNGE